MKTYSAKASEIDRKWWLVDAEGLVLGRLATLLADTIRGKNKPTYTPHADTGDFVVVINADKIRLTGRKLEKKMYYRHTGFPSGLRETNAAGLIERHPEQLIEKAVEGMLPRNRLSRQVIRKLKVYAGPEHPHDAQKPERLEVK